MMWRNPLAYRQNSAQAPSCGAMGFAGLPDVKDRANVIAYLASVK